MKNRKEVYLFALILFFVYFLLGLASSLGVSPGLTSYNFQPGFETSIRFTVFGESDKELEISFDGDFAQYAMTDKKTLKGGGEFIVSLKFPEKVEIPGRHRLGVRVAEKIDPELAAGFVTTSVTVIPVIDIYVPYPGRYLDISLTGQDANVGEPIDFNLAISSKGTDEVTVIPKIEVLSQEGFVKDTLIFSERVIKSQEGIALKKTLNTTNYNPGKYKARAYVDYGLLATSDFDFKIGSLVIDILNYTQRVPINKIERFDIQVESGWNSLIEGAYADVLIFNGTQVLADFKTTSTALIPWERKVITGYIDTKNLSEGIYDGNITLIYYGKEQGKSTNKLIKVEFFKEKSLLLWYLIGGAGLLIIISLILIKILSKPKKFKGVVKKRK